MRKKTDAENFEKSDEHEGQGVRFNCQAGTLSRTEGILGRILCTSNSEVTSGRLSERTGKRRAVFGISCTENEERPTARAADTVD